MQCPQCSTENRQGSQFCKKCGTSLTGVSSKRDKVMSEGNTSSGKWIVLVAVIAIAAGLGGYLSKRSGEEGVSNKAVSSSRFTPVTPEGGVIKISLDNVSDGQAHYFTYAHNGKPVNFFVLKSQDGVIRVAFDTCDVCYPHKKGYRQEGGEMVCNQCDQRFPADKINEVKGGCNPAPINRNIEGSTLIISQADIAAGAWYF